MKTFVIGDIHGAHKALLQCLDRSGFDRENDTLITLGDICDGWPYVYECVEELLKIKNIINIIGNHDQWFLKWYYTLCHPDYWGSGAKNTAVSYLSRLDKEMNIKERWTRTLEGQIRPIYDINILPEDVPFSHIRFFEGQQLFYKDEQNRVFVHAGFNKEKTLRENQRDDSGIFFWDRELWKKALCCKAVDVKLKFKEEITAVFLGHTATVNWRDKKGNQITVPIYSGGVWNMDTGAGFAGNLTIINVDTLKYWQSDNVNDIL